MATLSAGFGEMQIKFDKLIADWPYISENNYLRAEQIYNEFNEIFVFAAGCAIEDQHRLRILQVGAKHLLEHENEGLPGGLEDAMAAVMADAIENADSPLHAALLALVRHRAQQASREL